MISLGAMDSPIGALTVAARDGRVCLLHFGSDRTDARRALQRWYPGEVAQESRDPAGVITTLRAYFAGELCALDGIAVEMNGTPFQRRVWAVLRDVRAGTTASYADIACAIGAPAAVRAVGAANGANPVALIVPCHRIIGSNGTLTGYGGGMDRKRWLLQHERVLLGM